MDGSNVKFPNTPRKGGLLGWRYVGCAVIKIGFGGLHGGIVYWWVVRIGGATFVWHGFWFWNCREKNFWGGGGGPGGGDFTMGIFFKGIGVGCAPLNPEETKLFENRKKEYLSVIPCCQNESCIKKNIKFESGKYSGWICKRKRGSLLNQKEEKKKRKAQHDIAQERVNKRRKFPIPKD